MAGTVETCGTGDALRCLGQPRGGVSSEHDGASDSRAAEHGCATLVCAPFALHRANIADFAEGHSILEALRKSGLARLFLTDWRSATSSMCNLSIDSYLADLNVAVDEIGAPVNLIGLCQGGWMALLFAARFPEKVRRLVLAGAPVDIAAGESYLSRLAADAPLTAFESLVDLGKGRVLGRHALNAWGSALSVTDLNCVLQIEKGTEEVRLDELKRRFTDKVVPTLIRRDPKLKEAASFGQPSLPSGVPSPSLSPSFGSVPLASSRQFGMPSPSLSTSETPQPQRPGELFSGSSGQPSPPSLVPS